MFAVNNNPYIVTTDMYAVGIQINMRRYSRTDARRAADPPGAFPGFPIVGCLSSGSTGHRWCATGGTDACVMSLTHFWRKLSSKISLFADKVAMLNMHLHRIPARRLLCITGSHPSLIIRIVAGIIITTSSNKIIISI